MNMNEAIVNTQKKKVGLTNKASVRYAQSQLLPGEDVVAAVVANVRTKKENFPGVVAITDQRILVACGLPGIKRCISFPLEDLENCEEASTIIQYKATFRTRRDAFAMTTDPEVGESFSSYIAQLNGENLNTVKLKVTGKILNSTILQQKKRNQMYKEQSKARNISNDIELQKKAAAQFDSDDSDL